jgi:hypothetical protein
MRDKIEGEARESGRLGPERKMQRCRGRTRSERHRFAELWTIRAKLRAQHLHRAIGRCRRLAHPPTSLFPSSSPALRRCPPALPFGLPAAGCLAPLGCIEYTEAKVLAQRVVGHERVERSPLPNNLLARGGENLGERGGFFIVQVDPALGMSMGASRVPA